MYRVLAFRVLAGVAVVRWSRPAWPRPRGSLLEIFVNPLNLVGPLWPRVGVILPIVLAVSGRQCRSGGARGPVWTILVLPIALAMVASA